MKATRHNTYIGRHNLRINQKWKLAPLALGTAVLWLLYNLLFSTITLTGENRTITAPDHRQQTSPQGTPENVVQALDEYKDWYESVSQEFVSGLLNYFQAFRNTTYDRWGMNYEEVQAGM